MTTATLLPPSLVDDERRDSSTTPRPALKRGEPVWAIAEEFPLQGNWDDAEYLLHDFNGHRVELVDGCLEFLVTPIWVHESLANFLVRKLEDVVGRDAALPSGYKLRIRNRVPRRRNDYRLPDVIASVERSGFGPKFATSASFVAEIVSHERSDHDRDLVEKRADYAEAGVPEYWIVDPETQTVLQLRLDDGAYVEVGTFGSGSTVKSFAVPGFKVSIDEMFDTPAARQVSTRESDV